MKKKLLELKEQRALKSKALNDLAELVLKEDRQFKADELTQNKTLVAEIDDLDDQIEAVRLSIENAKRIADRAMSEMGGAAGDGGAPDGERKEVRKIQKRFNILAGLRGLRAGKLEGVEKEVHEMAEAECKADNRTLEGFGIPAIMTTREASSALTANEGTEFVPTHLAKEVIMPFRPNLLVEQIGVNFITGLTGNLDIPKVTNEANAAWEGEFTDAQNTQIGTDSLNAKPNRLASYTDIGKQWLMQSSPDAQNIVTQWLLNGQRDMLDKTFWIGVDNGKVAIVGLVDQPDVNVVEIGANGGAITDAKIIDMETAIAEANADGSNMVFCTTPGVRGFMKKQIVDSGTNERLWAKGTTEPVNGYKAFVSTQIPNTLTKGTLAGTAHAAFFGDFSGATVMQWGGYDLIIENITQALKAKIRIVNNAYYDIKFPQPEKISVIKGIDAAATPNA